MFKQRDNYSNNRGGGDERRGGGGFAGGPARMGGGGSNGNRFSGGQSDGFKSKKQDFGDMRKPNWGTTTLRPFIKDNYKETNIIRNRAPAIAADYFRMNAITVSGDHPIKPIIQFNECDLPNSIMDRIREAKYEKPTLIQSMCWPALMTGNDIVGIAQTGSGKTLGFIMPILMHITSNQRYIASAREDAPGPVALVLAPTRELAIQIQQVAEQFGDFAGIKNIVIYGGASKGPQTQQIRRGAEIYIATPGRLLDFIKEGTISLGRCTFLVLDEADRMLDMGFEPQIRKIIEQIRPDRQTAMFSATWPKEVRKLAEDFVSNYIHIAIGAQELSANPKIKQIVEVIQESDKMNRLKQILGDIMRGRDAKAIVFSETKKKVDIYSRTIRDMGFHCLAIHGDKKQQEREWVLGEFRKKPKSILVATDVAARGINIEDIKFVINIDYPMQTEDYVHRIGRTARSSNTGTAFTFITRDNARHVPKLIEILREANQDVNPDLYSLCRGGGSMKYGAQAGGAMGRPGGFAQKRSYNDYTGPSEYSMGTNGAQRSKFGNQNFEQDDYEGEPRAKKRDSNDFKSNGMDDQNRIKKHRWDSDNGNMNGGSLPNLMSAPVRPANGYNNGNNNYSGSNGQNGYSNGNSYNNNGNFNNGHANGSSRPAPVNGNSYSNGSNGASAIPKLSSLVVQPPPPPPSGPSAAASGSQPGMYPPEYSQMYSLQYYQAIAASAAKNGGNWQTAATNLWTQPSN